MWGGGEKNVEVGSAVGHVGHPYLYVCPVSCVLCPAVNVSFAQDTLCHMTFYFNARYALVTYAQCGTLDEWSVSDHFSSLGAECIVAREAHADGGTHFHVFCDFGRKFRSRRADIFDVGGRHPNIKRTKKSPRAGVAYACKYGEIVAGGLDIGDVSDSLIPTTQDPGSTLLCAENQREFFDIAEEFYPWDFITKFPNFRAFAKWKWPEVGEPYASPAGFGFADGDFPDLVEYRGRILDVRGKCLNRPTLPSGSRGSLGGSTSLLGLFANVLLGHAWSDLAPPLGPLFEQCSANLFRRSNQVSSDSRATQDWEDYLGEDDRQSHVPYVVVQPIARLIGRASRLCRVRRY